MPEAPEDLRLALVRLGLLDPEERPAFTPLTGGVSSDIWRVDLRSGPVCIKRALSRLKVAADWRAPVERNRYEAAWLRLAAEAVPGAVPALAGQDAETGSLVMAFLDPADHPVWKERLRAGEAVDLDAAVSSEVPLAALARLLELDVDAATEVKRFSRAALELFWGRPDLERQLALARIVGPYHAVLRSWAASSTGATRRVLEAHGEDAATAALFFLLVAGQETTSQFLTLLAHELIGSPGLLDAPAGAVVEEGLRLLPPLVSWRRVAAVDTAIGGAAVAAGESVLVWLAAAGADEGVAQCPAAMVPGQRGSRRHLAFGAGAHRCLGSQLARMEAEVVVAELAPLLRRCAVVSPPAGDENLSFRMPGPLVVAMR